ncbi:uncharacterized protein LOC114321552 [Camellia sinensis]|uniref:uncharacterized protein LOC114321552 n=1 Tax=Camellia sinensis TaxID=4442 RepID=UPI00103694F4|nr:uncharacterized protein LOC114321552 [Camellia sinensis]
MTIANNIKASLPQTVNALEYLKAAEDRFRSADKSLAGTIMAELTTMKYDGNRGVQDHILNMADKVAKLKTLGMQVDETFLEEVRLREEGRQTALVVTHGAIKKKKVTSNTWWIDSGATTHITNDMQGYLSTRKPKESERFVYMGNRLKAEVVAVGTYRLILETAEARIFNPQEKNLDSRTISRYFIGYPDKSKGYKFYCPNHSMRIVETGNARFLENGEISGSEKTRVVNFEEIRVDMPTFDPYRKIVVPQTIPQAEGNEQHNENPSPPHVSPFHEDTTIENIVEPPQPAVLRRSQRERKPVIPNDYMENAVDQCIYLKVSGSKFIMLVLYVDDILLASNDLDLLHKTKEYLSKNFKMVDMGEANNVIGIEIFRDRSRGLLGLSQKGYIDRVLERFNMRFCSVGDAPIMKGDKLSEK